MDSRLTKKQQTELTEKLMGVIQKNNALQLRLSADRSVNEMNVNQISGALNRIHGQAIGKELPTEITIPVKQLGSGDPSPDNIRPFVGYEIDGIGTVYGGDLNIETGVLTSSYALSTISRFNWYYQSGTLEDLRNGFYADIPGKRHDVVNCNVYSDYYASYPVNGTSVLVLINMPDNNITGFNGESTRSWCYIKDNAFNDRNAFITARGAGIIAYELETPVTYNLTPEQMLQLLYQL